MRIVDAPDVDLSAIGLDWDSAILEIRRLQEHLYLRFGDLDFQRRLYAILATQNEVATQTDIHL